MSITNVNIVCGADDRFAMPMTMMLFSALTTLGPGSHLSIYVIDGGLSPRSRDRCAKALDRAGKAYSITWIHPDLSRISFLPRNKYISRSTYLKILIPTVLPKEETKAIYLDCDMIVRTDLTKLWLEPFDDHDLLAVRDFHYSTMSRHDAIPHWAELGHQASTPYFNAGLLVINLESWRRQGVPQKIIEYRKTHPSKISLDQVGINAVLGQRWRCLDPRWNVTLSSLASYDETYFDVPVALVKNDPWIIHYTSWFKPWMIATRNKAVMAATYYDQAFREEFFRIFEASGWYGPLRTKSWIAVRRLALTVLFKAPRRVHLALEKAGLRTA